jgi:hypothetical protein
MDLILTDINDMDLILTDIIDVSQNEVHL